MRPINIDARQLAVSAPELISAARTDPDGKAIQIALTRRVKVFTVPSNTSFILNLLPENWSCPMPSMPE
jgi:hypothetical protein